MKSIQSSTRLLFVLSALIGLAISTTNCGNGDKVREDDQDGDGIPDSVEGTGDMDGDGLPNYMDADSDGDGIPDSVEAGRDPRHPVDSDKDGSPDYQDTDSDNDGIGDMREAGEDPTNPVDTDKDGKPDYIDEDSDNDNHPDRDEGLGDCDQDGVPNYIDPDDWPDMDGHCSETAGDADGDGDSDTDTDGDTDADSDTDTDADGDTDGDIDGDGDSDAALCLQDCNRQYWCLERSKEWLRDYRCESPWNICCGDAGADADVDGDADGDADAAPDAGQDAGADASQDAGADGAPDAALLACPADSGTPDQVQQLGVHLINSAPYYFAQSFVPAHPILNSVEVEFEEHNDPGAPLTIQIRTSTAGAPSNTVIAEATLNPSPMTSGWFCVDFDDVSVVPGATYWIAFNPAAGSTQTGDKMDFWVIAIKSYYGKDVYPPGAAFVSASGSGGWADLKDVNPALEGDFAFTTVGSGIPPDGGILDAGPLDSGLDAGVQDAAPPVLKYLGEACETNGDCASGQCGDDGLCTDYCYSTEAFCPPNMFCSPYMNTDGMGLCSKATLPADVLPLDSCDSNEKCHSQQCDTGDAGTDSCLEFCKSSAQHCGFYDCAPLLVVDADPPTFYIAVGMCRDSLPFPGSGAMGADCASVDECETGFCELSSYYCTGPCCSDLDCPADLLCTDVIVNLPIADAKEWPTLVRECAKPSGAKLTGASCGGDEECQSGWCIGSMCVASCCSDYDCTASETCEPVFIDVGDSAGRVGEFCVPAQSALGLPRPLSVPASAARTGHGWLKPPLRSPASPIPVHALTLH